MVLFTNQNYKQMFSLPPQKQLGAKNVRTLRLNFMTNGLAYQIILKHEIAIFVAKINVNTSS